MLVHSWKWVVKSEDIFLFAPNNCSFLKRYCLWWHFLRISLVLGDKPKIPVLLHYLCWLLPNGGCIFFHLTLYNIGPLFTFIWVYKDNEIKCLLCKYPSLLPNQNEKRHDVKPHSLEGWTDSSRDVTCRLTQYFLTEIRKYSVTPELICMLLLGLR